MNKEILLLFNACHNGNVAYILNHLDFNLVNCTNEDDRSLLHIACINNDNEMAKTILKYLPNVNVEDKNKFLPVTYLIKNNNLNLIQEIFENYSGAFSKEQLVKNMSIACMYDNIDIFKYFHNLLNFDLNAQDNNGNSYLMICAKYNSIKIYNYLIKNSANLLLENYDKNNVLIFAASANAYTIFEDVINKIDINFQNAIGVNALMVSTLYEHYNLINLILEKNANTKLRDIDGNTALHYAVLNNDKKASLQIVKVDESLVNEKNNDGNTPVMLAVIQNNIELVELLMNFNVDLNLENNKDENAFEISWFNGNMNMAKLILSKFDHKKLRDLKINLEDANEINNLIKEKVEEVKNEVELNFRLEDESSLQDPKKPSSTIEEEYDETLITDINIIDEDSDINISDIDYEDDAIWDSQSKKSISSLVQDDVIKSSSNSGYNTNLSPNIKLIRDQINLEENERFRIMITENLKNKNHDFEEFNSDIQEVSNNVNEENETNNITELPMFESESNSNLLTQDMLNSQEVNLEDDLEEKPIKEDLKIKKENETQIFTNDNISIINDSSVVTKVDELTIQEENKIKAKENKELKNINERGNTMNGKEFNSRYNIKWLINEEEHNQIINGEKESIFMEGQIKTTPLIYLSKIGKTKALFELLKKEPQRVHDKASNNKNGLMYAAQYNNVNCAKLLILVGININATDDHGTTALMYATFMGNIEIVKLLLTHRVDVSLKDASGLTALDIAIKNNDKEIIDLLVSYQNKEIICAKTMKIDLPEAEYI